MKEQTQSDPVPAETELQSLRSEVERLREELRQIVNMCDAPHWTTERRYRIRDKAKQACK